MTEKKLSVESYKGTRDFYPSEMALQKYIFQTMRTAVEAFGYSEYGASTIEETELYRAKSGSEIVDEQTYTFEDRGGRDVTLRPEMTPTVARMIAKKRKELSFPLRWYSIPNLFRYERPQRGRLREHWQLNVDLFGVDSASADAEVIAVASNVMTSFGAGENDFLIRVNSRRLSDYFLRGLGVDEDAVYRLSKLIDRKDKMKSDDFKSQAQNLLGEETGKFIQFLSVGKISDLPEEFLEIPAVQELQNIINMLEQQGITNVQYDPTIMRGFDYYTGVVFEIHDTSTENNRSMFGGGRYDDLVGIFGVEKVTGVGFGMGDVTIRDFLETHNLLKNKIVSTIDLYLCVFDKEQEDHAQKLAKILRGQGIAVSVDITGRKISSQIKTADKQDIPFVICIGEDEIKTEKYKIKNMKNHEEHEVNKEQIGEYFK